MRGVSLERRTSIILALMAFIAAATLVFGYAGFRPGGSTADDRQFREERHRVVEAAQLWHVRPASRGGGGMSFDSLDFARAGLGAPPGALVWEGKAGRFEIVASSTGSFILRSQSLKGGKERIDTLLFDTMVE